MLLSFALLAVVLADSSTSEQAASCRAAFLGELEKWAQASGHSLPHCACVDVYLTPGEVGWLPKV